MSSMPTTEGQLPLEENRRIFREQIAPAFLDGCAPQSAPVANGARRRSWSSGGRTYAASAPEPDPRPASGREE
ncbi:hypothetical protein [Streptomyces sp. NPDC001500]